MNIQALVGVSLLAMAVYLTRRVELIASRLAPTGLGVEGKHHG